MVNAGEWQALENGNRWRMVGAGDWEALETGRRWSHLNFVRLRQELILALDFSSGPLTNFKGAFHKIPCGHSPLKVMIMSQKWLPQRSERSLPKNCPTRNGGLRKLVITLTALLPRNLDQVCPGPSNCAGHTAL